MRGVWLCVVAVLAALAHVLHAECPHEPADRTLRRWSDASSWPSGKPEAGSAVVISDDVVLDEDTPSLGSVTVNAGGSLVFSPEGDVTLTTNYLLLHGALHIGSEDCPYTAKARIVLTGTRGQYDVQGFGEKFMGVTDGGTLELHGQNKLSWAKLTSTVSKLDYRNGLHSPRKLDDPDVSNTGRGLVAYINNGTTGESKFKEMCVLVSERSSKVISEPPRLVQALNDTQDGDLVVLAVQWNAIGYQVDMNPIYDAIERAAYGDVTGTSAVRQLGEYDAWALVAVRGEFVKEELVTLVNSDRRKEARVSAVVPSLGNVVVSVVSSLKPSHYQGGFTDVMFIDNDRVLTLSSDVTTWQPGDRLLVTSTDFDWKQSEEAEVTYCSPQECDSNQVKVLFPNDYMHFGGVTDGVDEGAEVALLSRNIVIEGKMEDECPDANGNCDLYDMDTFGGHVRIEGGFHNVHIEGVELRHMGQIMEADRYPIFFHQCGDVDEVGNYTSATYVRSTSITNSYSKCVVLSGTHGLLIEDNVAYDHHGSCYVLKEGGEKRTVLDGNLGVGTRRIEDYNPLDTSASTFFITNPLTYFRNNVAGGSYKRGIWYVFPVEPIGESAGKGIMQPHEARHTAFTEFTNIATHSNQEFGLYFNQGLNEEGDGTISMVYQPRVDPLDDSSDDEATVLNRLTGFKNRYRNAYIRGGYFILDHWSMAQGIGPAYNPTAGTKQWM